MCRLVKALYGHPESGGHWENHLTQAIIQIGGEKVPNHPSSFWFPLQKSLLTVCVDDLLLAGPVGSHADLWHALSKVPIELDPPEDLDRFIGRTHRTQSAK